MKQISNIIVSIFFLFSHYTIAADTQTLHAVEKKPVAPEFELKDIDDKVYKLSDYRGKVVVINFWTTWCPPCRYEIPSMERAQEKLQKDDIVLLAINIGEDEETIFEFSGHYNINFPLLMDIDSSIIKKYPVIGLPTTYIVDPEGRIAYRAIGSREWDAPEIINKLKALK